MKNIVPESSGYREELETAINASETAGNTVDRAVGGKIANWNKDDGSYVTEIDLKCQEKIIETISESFPDDGFQGEEEDASPDGEERVWVIDPIDGTFNFRKNMDFYCVSIALKVDDEAKVGVVYSPENSLNELYYAVKGEGAYIQEDDRKSRKLQTSKQDKISDSAVYAHLLNVYEENLERDKNFLTDLMNEGGVTREIGTCALEMCKVASGRADGSVHAIVKEWDFRASKLIVEEAGGTVRVRESWPTSSYEVVSTNGVIQRDLEKTVSDHFQ